MDPGPRALLKGEKLIQEGKSQQAIEPLQRAVRLLPRTAQAYNLLGLAYHRTQQPEPAQRFYRHALALDNNLAAARFNLGCLLLEMNDLQGAIDQLTSYTYLQPNTASGWVKLGSAQLRARRVDAAEKAYRAAAALEPRNAEALNGLGSVQFYRRRMPEAYQLFNQALVENPQYDPALLNAAIVAHQSLNNRRLALQLYRRYLALKPRPPQWDAVNATATQLDLELNPPPPQLALVRTNPPVAVVETARQRGGELTNRVTNEVVNRGGGEHAPVAVAPVPRLADSPAAPIPSPPNQSPPKTNLDLVLTPSRQPVQPVSNPAPELTLAQLLKPIISASIASNPVAAAPATSAPATLLSLVSNSASRPAGDAPAKPAATQTPIAANPPVIEVSRLPDELVINPAQEIVPLASNPVSNPLIEAKPVSAVTSIPGVAPTGDRPEKRSWISRLMPFRGKSKPITNNVVTLVTPESEPAPAVAKEEPVEPAAAPAPVPDAKPPRVVPRYAYIRPAKPSPGNRGEAEPFFVRGLKAHRSGDTYQALSEYQRATQSDPTHFEAWYNQGLAFYEVGKWNQSLQSYEWALALTPDSVDARYNFALALKQANFPQDAANELTKIIERHPEEARAHLTLANLCAYHLQQPGLAREHFLKVLSLEPQCPQATEIRSWLGSQLKADL